MNYDTVLLNWLHAQGYRVVGGYQDYIISRLADAEGGRLIPIAWLSAFTTSYKRRDVIVMHPIKLVPDHRTLRDAAIEWMLGL